MLRAAQTARDKEVFEKKRQETIAERKAEIEKLLDGLHLELAERRLRESISELDDRRAFAPLRSRLAQLRDAERVSAELSTVASSLAHGESLDHVAQATARVRQQALAATYSWPQALFYPFRGLGSLVVLGLYLFMIGAESLPSTGWSQWATLARIVVSVLAAGFGLGIVRATLNGQNRLSDQALDLRAWLLDLPLVALIAAFSSLPWLAFALTRGRHQLFAEDHGLLGWSILAVLVWISAWAFVTACGAVGAFGRGACWRVIGHLRALAADADVSFAIHLVFVLGVAGVLLRVVPPPVAGLDALLASALEAWALLGVPHVIGVVVRRHRLELAKLYG